MRQYVVQPGDSPAKIASRSDMAGCPKCAADLVAANPQKQAVRYPNGFVTFKDLHVGEVLNIPDKWSNGTLDALPKAYFDNLPSPNVSQTYLPQMASQAGGMGSVGGFGAPGPWVPQSPAPPPPAPSPSFPHFPSVGPRGRGSSAFLPEPEPGPQPWPMPGPTIPPELPQIPPSPPPMPPEPVPLSRRHARGMGQLAPHQGSRQPAPSPGGRQPAPSPGSRQPAPSPGSRQPAPAPGGRQPAPHSGGGRQHAPGFGYRSPARGNNIVSTSLCEQWAYYGTYTVGSNPVSNAVFAAASNWNNIGKTLWIGGAWYQFRALNAPVTQVGIYFCARQVASVGRGGYGSGPHFRGVGDQGVGITPIYHPGGPPLQPKPQPPKGKPKPPPPGQPPPPPPPYYGGSGGIPVPPQPTSVPAPDFVPQEGYRLMVWPIPAGPNLPADPQTVLNDLGFSITSAITDNGDGSYTADVLYTAAGDYVPDPNYAAITLVYTNSSAQHGGPQGQAILPSTPVPPNPGCPPAPPGSGYVQDSDGDCLLTTNITVPGNQLIVYPGTDPSSQWNSLTIDSGSGPQSVPLTPDANNGILLDVSGQGTYIIIGSWNAPSSNSPPLIASSSPAAILYNFLIQNGCQCVNSGGYPNSNGPKGNPSAMVQYTGDFQISIGVKNPDGIYGPNTQGSLQAALDQQFGSGYVAPLPCFGSDQYDVQGNWPSAHNVFPPCGGPPGYSPLQEGALLVAAQGGVNPTSIPAFNPGDMVRGVSSGVMATVNGAWDDPTSQDGVVFFNSPPIDNKGNPTPFQTGELLRVVGNSGKTLPPGSIGGSAVAKYTYDVVLQDPAEGDLGVTQLSDLGTILQLPYAVQPGETVTMDVLAIEDAAGNLSDVTLILKDMGLDVATPPVQDPDDCSWSVTAVNNSGNPISVDDPLVDPVTSTDSAWMQSLSASVGVVKQKAAKLVALATPPTMTACHAFTLRFIPTPCVPLGGETIPGSNYDPTPYLQKLGLTNFTPTLPGPDELGQYEINGVWELGSGFTLPASSHLTITDFIDNGPATNVATGRCATSLPYTIQPGDSVNIIARPIGVPGQPMTNPVAVLEALGFTNVAPAATYSDCTWVITADYPPSTPIIPGSPLSQGPLQITDPMVSAGVGAMWIVGLAVNGTTIKNANWLQLNAQSVTLTQCNSYTVFFTYAVCPTLTGAPGGWDPTADLAALLPGFKIAPGPNEYGEWTATGVWTGQDQTTLQGTSNITITFLVDYGPSQGCTVGQTPTVPVCPSGQVNDLATNNCTDPCADGSAPTNGACPQVGCTSPLVVDSVTGKCVAACSDGSAPAKGVCPKPVKAAPPVTPPSTGTSTGTVVAVVGGGAVLAGLAYLALK